MSKRFALGISTIEDVTFLKISGVIDEDNHLERSVAKIEGSTVVLDLAAVERINSCGVRDWVNWLGSLSERGREAILVRCSPCIVTQLNLVHNFVGHGMVKSFFTPYFCPRCDLEQLELVQGEDFAGTDPIEAPVVRGRNCEEAQCDMEFDDLEAAYFAFLPRSGGARLEPDLHRHLESLSPTIRDRIKRLDRVAESDASNPSSGIYSPLTATTNPGPQGTDPLPPADRSAGKRTEMSGLRRALLTAAFAVTAGILAYVAYIVGN